MKINNGPQVCHIKHLAVKSFFICERMGLCYCCNKSVCKIPSLLDIQRSAVKCYYCKVDASRISHLQGKVAE